MIIYVIEYILQFLNESGTSCDNVLIPRNFEYRLFIDTENNFLEQHLINKEITMTQ